MEKTIPERLHRAAKYRALSLLFAPPDTALLEELKALSKDLAAQNDPLGTALCSLTDVATPELGKLYHVLVGPAGVVRDCESDYEVNPLGGKGPLLADIAGFYLAFQFEDRSLLGLSPDHLAQELGFLGWLAFRSAFAMHSNTPEGTDICDDAAMKFVRDHLGRWVSTCFARVHERCADTWYDEAARITWEALQVLEPGGKFAPPTKDRVALPTLNDSDECGLPPDA